MARTGGLPVGAGERAWTAQEVTAQQQELTLEAERLREEVAALEASVAEVMRDGADGSGDDHADTGSKAVGREQELALLGTARSALLQTEAALGRITNGGYGRCELCSEPIGKARLQAFPRASMCVSCKQREERR